MCFLPNLDMAVMLATQYYTKPSLPNTSKPFEQTRRVRCQLWNRGNTTHLSNRSTAVARGSLPHSSHAAKSTCRRCSHCNHCEQGAVAKYPGASLWWWCPTNKRRTVRWFRWYIGDKYVSPKARGRRQVRGSSHATQLWLQKNQLDRISLLPLPPIDIRIKNSECMQSCSGSKY